ncbi:hypothetical protein [Pelagibius sp.]|uniref:hypothetical protein n=1 Tax=Pelagibius sp. TaxID=1931238 RepID=UPI003B514F1F
MIVGRRRRALILAAAGLALAGGLAACGKKGSPKPPVGEEAAYTYPQPYPAPETVGPPPAGEDPRETRGLFTIFEDDRTETTTY